MKRCRFSTTASPAVFSPQQGIQPRLYDPSSFHYLYVIVGGKVFQVIYHPLFCNEFKEFGGRVWTKDKKQTKKKRKRRGLKWKISPQSWWDTNYARFKKSNTPKKI